MDDAISIFTTCSRSDSLRKHILRRRGEDEDVDPMCVALAGDRVGSGTAAKERNAVQTRPVAEPARFLLKLSSWSTVAQQRRTLGPPRHLTSPWLMGPIIKVAFIVSALFIMRLAEEGVGPFAQRLNLTLLKLFGIQLFHSVPLTWKPVRTKGNSW